jgi:putative transposase
MTRKFKLSVGEYYHIYNRGVEKRDIFLDSGDYNRFLILLYLLNSSIEKPVNLRDYKGLTFVDFFKVERVGERLVEIGAFCLMKNHFHLLIKEVVDNGISLFMQRLSTAYTMYFNSKNERSGSLFQGTFKAELADTDEYLRYLFSYIHLNPVKNIDPSWKEKGLDLESDFIKKYLMGYRFSSFMDYAVGDRVENNILNVEVFPEYFNNKKEFIFNVFEWLDYNK